MSQWTYVFGSFYGPVSDKETEETLKDVLGTVTTWDDAINQRISQQQWSDAFDKTKNPIPMGSEGSIEYELSFRENPSFGKTAYITFTGYLRDYGDSEEDIDYIRKWFISVFNRLGLQPFAYIKIKSMGKTLSYEIYDHKYPFKAEKNNKIYRFVEQSAQASYSGFLDSAGVISTRIVKITDKGKVRNAEKEIKKKLVSR